ncbi:MAG: type IV-A pilus assembly ATPase PilB, partial [Pseudomonadota bacterium]
MVATASTVGLSGLPRRLVRDGIVEETAIQEAQVAAKEEKTPLVAYLIKNELAESRDVAIAASQEFGVPLLDLDAVEVDTEVVRTVNEELLVKHRVLPLLKRGKKLFVGVSDPTNLQALDEIKFQTGFSVDAIVVEQDKLEESVAKALEAMDT